MEKATATERATAQTEATAVTLKAKAAEEAKVAGRRAGAATLIAALWREAAGGNAAAATRKVKARRAEVELVLVAARAEEVQAATNEVVQAAVQAWAHVRAQAAHEENTQIWVRAVGSHDSRSVMVSLGAPTGDTKLARDSNACIQQVEAEPGEEAAASPVAAASNVSKGSDNEDLMARGEAREVSAKNCPGTLVICNLQ